VALVGLVLLVSGKANLPRWESDPVAEQRESDARRGMGAGETREDAGGAYPRLPRHLRERISRTGSAHGLRRAWLGRNGSRHASTPWAVSQLATGSGGLPSNSARVASTSSSSRSRSSSVRR
jgi:hypothetical protein